MARRRPRASRPRRQNDNQADLFDPVAARADRDMALARVSANAADWIPRALLALARRPAGETGTAEDFRRRLVGDGLPLPHHHNAWGALVRMAIGAEIIAPTGERRAMRGPRSHARETAVYRRA